MTSEFYIEEQRYTEKATVEIDKNSGKIHIQADKVVMYKDKINFSVETQYPKEKGKKTIRGTVHKIDGNWYITSGRQEFSVRISEKEVKQMISAFGEFLTPYRAGPKEFRQNTGL